MKRSLLLLFAAAAVVAGCSKSSDHQASAASSSTAGEAAVSKYDSGPRAGESAVNDELAERGEKLFKDKGCSACHTFGQKLSGPDLKGVTMRRTAQWMENQILHPDVMTKEDPISHQMLAQFALQMPNQGLTPDEAQAVIEFLKHQDKKSGESK